MAIDSLSVFTFLKLDWRVILSVLSVAVDDVAVDVCIPYCHSC